ncbi:MAG TPA: VIT domain-containing protein [Thermoplasmata archaeon]
MNATRFAFVVALVLAAFLNAPGPAAAFCVIVEPPSPLPTQVNGTQVEIQLTEGFARVVIIKEFSNPSDEFKQGQIAFPLEKGHELITDLRLKIGNVVYNSSTQNRSDALGDFLDAIAKGQDAALVQYDPPRDLYWIAVTIPPKEARTTITTLEMPLTKTDGFYEYGYRLSIDARDSVSYLRVHVRVETAAPLGEVLLPGHPDIPVVWSGSHRADAYINATQGAGTGDLPIRFRASGASLSQFAEPTGDRYVRFSLDSTDAAFASSIRPAPRALVVLVDTSGSMGLLDRWALAKDAVRRIAGDAHAGESFGVAVFQGAAVTPFSPSLQAWSPAVDGELARFLDSFRPHGSTGLTAALAQASLWALEARRLGQQPVLILVSDGRPTRSPLDPELETAYARISYDQGMPVFAMAVAPADHADETVLHNLSHYHGGELVTLDGDVPAAVADLVASMRVPILEGLRTEIPAAANLTFASANPQTVWQGGEALAIARMRGTAEDSLDLTLTWPAASGGTPALDVRTAGADIPAQPLLKREWALTRIHALLEAARAREDPAVVAELTALATETRVATPYTSLLVLLPQTEQAADRSVSDGSLAGAPLFGPGAGLASPASSGQGFSPVFVPPLVAEARTADALNRDLANPLIAQGEIDRYVDVGSAEYQRLDTPAATSRYEGTYFRVLEVGGELVAVRLGSPEAAQLAANGVGFAGMILAVLALVRLPRRGPRSRNDAADVRTKPELRREVNAPGDGRGLRASGRTSSHIARANSRRRLGRTKPIEERVTSSLAQTAVGYSRARRYCRQWYPRRAFWPWTAIPPSGPIEIVNESGGIFHPRPTALT